MSRSYLLFRLYGPLAAWGEIAVGENRHSARYPSRSALLGLLGAALGIRREDEAGQQQLSASVRFAVLCAAGGQLLRDFHTMQAPSARKNKSWQTRAQALAEAELNTLISNREYVHDALAIVALELSADSVYRLTQLQQALLQPVYQLWLGRKSCPLAAPLQPQIVQADSLHQAFARASFMPLHSAAWRPRRNADAAPVAPTDRSDCHSLQQQIALQLKADLQHLRASPADIRYYWDEAMQDSGLPPGSSRQRHDQPLSRQRWQFEARHECLYQPAPTSSAAEARDPAAELYDQLPDESAQGED